MSKLTLPQEFDLKATRRYRRQNMAKAMGGKIERALVELITNSDDSYKDLEELGKNISGKITIEIERKRSPNPSIVKVFDRAAGMSGEEMYKKIGVVGDRTSGFEKGKSRRGLYGRGAKDVAIFGTTHFESIKNEKYSHLIISPSLMCKFEEADKLATPKERKKLGLIRGNGTVVTIEVGSGYRIPTHEKLFDVLSRFYSLRDIMSNINRELILIDKNCGKTTPLIYKYPEGEIVIDKTITIPGYANTKTHILIKQHETPFQQDNSPVREGILIKSGAAIHDCTYFQLDPDIYCWRFSGEIHCDFIDTLIREFDEIESSSDNPSHPNNNPIMILDPNRDGLDRNHPFTHALYQSCRIIVKELISSLKAKETPEKKKVSDDYLNKKLDSLSKNISKLFEDKLKELEEEVEDGTEQQGMISNLPIGLHIIPPGEEKIIANVPKVFTIKVISYEELNESLPIVITSSNSSVSVRATPVFLKRFSEDRKIATTTFILESDKVDEEAIIDVCYNGYSNVILVNVEEPPAPQILPVGLSFDKTNYNLTINKEKNVFLWLNDSNIIQNEIQADIISNHKDIVIKCGGKCVLKRSKEINIFKGKCLIVGRRIKVKGTIAAKIPDLQTASANVTVEDKELKSHIKLKFIPDEDDFGTVRYKWDDDNPYVLKIAAKHASIRQYLGLPESNNYIGIDSPLYHCVLAEVVAEALAFNILERQFRTEGQNNLLDYTTVDANFHKHYSDFLAICHKTLNFDIDLGQPKMF